MEKLFDKLPYDDIEEIQYIHLLAYAIGIGLVIFVAYYFTLFSATNTEFEKLSKKKEEAERTLKRYKATAKKEEMVAKNLSRIKGQLNAFKNQMPDQNEVPDLMKKIVAFGNHRNIKMVSLTLEEGEIKDFYKVIPLKMQIYGELWVTLDFMEYVQNLLRLVSIDNLVLQGQNVQISGAGGNFSPGSLNTTLIAKTYSYMDGAENRAEAKKAHKKKKKKSH
jgi:type IV pilus assembly protein PilO